MHWFSTGVALLAAIGIVAIGLMYLWNPRTATQSFGLPLPEAGANVAWWLRLKGVRDVVSGLVLLGLMAWGGRQLVGIVLAIEALIPLGDMLLILAAQGSARRAFAVHGLTALLMLASAGPMIAGIA